MDGYIWYLAKSVICAGKTKAEHQAIIKKVLQQ